MNFSDTKHRFCVWLTVVLLISAIFDSWHGIGKEYLLNWLALEQILLPNISSLAASTSFRCAYTDMHLQISYSWIHCNMKYLGMNVFKLRQYITYLSRVLFLLT